MVSIKAIQQDARREIGNTMEVRGTFGELKRLIDRIESGDLAPEELERESAELDEQWDEADMLLRRHGLDRAADLLERRVHKAMSSAGEQIRRKAGLHEPRYTEYGEFGPL